jgi:hypothetical protein
MGASDERYGGHAWSGEVGDCAMNPMIHSLVLSMDRRHLQHLQHHILGDTSYGKGRLNQALRDGVRKKKTLQSVVHSRNSILVCSFLCHELIRTIR